MCVKEFKQIFLMCFELLISKFSCGDLEEGKKNSTVVMFYKDCYFCTVNGMYVIFLRTA